MSCSYDESLLAQATNTLGKAFDFADKHLPGGMEHFFDLFMVSPTARTFDGPDAQPAVGASGIELVLSVCDSEQNAGLDTMLMSGRHLPRDQRGRARWCGEVLAYHQWETGRTFRAISTYLSAADLIALHADYRVASPRVVSAVIEKTLVRTASPTRLKTLRSAAGLTQAALASSSGVSLRSIQQYEQRKKDINHAQALSVHRLAQALSCHVEDLLEL